MQLPTPQPTPASTTHPPVLLPLAAAMVAFVLPWLGPLAYPFRLLTTIVHELGHGLAAMLTGGSFLRFVVFPNGSGLAYTAGGNPWLIIPAGYLGAALFGAALIMLGRSPQVSRATLALLGGALSLLTLRYALPAVFSSSVFSGMLTLVAGLGFGALLIGVAWKLAAAWSLALLNLLAFAVGLSAIGDLTTLFRITTTPAGAALSDAHAMAQLSGIPAIFWAVAWVTIAVALLGAAFWATWLKKRA
jgi:hypothetical protein